MTTKTGSQLALVARINLAGHPCRADYGDDDDDDDDGDDGDDGVVLAVGGGMRLTIT